MNNLVDQFDLALNNGIKHKRVGIRQAHAPVQRIQGNRKIGSMPAKSPLSGFDGRKHPWSGAESYRLPAGSRPDRY